MRKCDSCGKLYQESKDVFCPHCGAVAQKQCIHGSSFDSKRYDRGEIYKSNNSQYQNTTYNKGFEPHAQREKHPYNKTENEGNSGGSFPELSLPDLTKKLSKTITKGSNNGKLIAIIICACVFGLNMILGLVNYDGVNGTDYWEDTSEFYIEEDINDLYTIADKAIIEVAEADGSFTSFTLEISGMGFDDYLPENMLDDISSSAMAKEILSEDTFVETLVCNFSEESIDEEGYNTVLNNAYLVPGEQVEGNCKYEFTHSFDYDEIVHIGSGVDFYLDNGKHINAELPFSAFSVSEDGKITYYTSYADSETAWNTVFSECSNEQDTGRDVFIDLGE